MQVLCMVATDDHPDLACPMCGHGYKVYFSRFITSERKEALKSVLDVLIGHHLTDGTLDAHPREAFNVPEWRGAASTSAAALLGGAPAGLFGPAPETQVA